jgi:hypothetical protein
LPEGDILLLGVQYFFRILFSASTFNVFFQNFSLKVVCTDCLILICQNCTFCFSFNASKFQPSVGLVLIHQFFI